MALCNELEARLKERAGVQGRFARAGEGDSHGLMEEEIAVVEGSAK